MFSPCRPRKEEAMKKVINSIITMFATILGLFLFKRMNKKEVESDKTIKKAGNLTTDTKRTILDKFLTKQ